MDMPPLYFYVAKRLQSKPSVNYLFQVCNFTFSALAKNASNLKRMFEYKHLLSSNPQPLAPEFEIHWRVLNNHELTIAAYSDARDAITKLISDFKANSGDKAGLRTLVVEKFVELESLAKECDEKVAAAGTCSAGYTGVRLWERMEKLRRERPEWIMRLDEVERSCMADDERWMERLMREFPRERRELRKIGRELGMV
ncbi:hypothetical protein BDV96DRAFT_181561 [Lophiotrema nucula]|uniref:Uncharacterized protein n=1 Tax=Lophiotrema nucula TaxID=690887 RepID=A0A6A5YW46_9PLEO|nr:hypothetical protein BDV96DRAFT_181561 [Lophiotrema nucula]